MRAAARRGARGAAVPARRRRGGTACGAPPGCRRTTPDAGRGAGRDGAARRRGERDGTSSDRVPMGRRGDRKSTRLNSSHTVISYAVFCLKKKKKKKKKNNK